MRRGACLLALALAMAWVLPLPARADGNTTAFTLEAHDARAFALGGTLTLLPKDDTAVRWNPALLVFCDYTSATASFSQPAAGLSADHTAISASTPTGRVVPDADPGQPVHRTAAGLLLMTSGFDLSEGDRWSETQFGAGMAYAFNPYVMAGATLRYLGNSTPAAQAAVHGYSLDLGLAVLMSPRLELGAVIRNAMGRVRWSDLDLSESPPNVLDLAAALDGDRLRGELGLEVSSAQTTRTRFGAEYGLAGGALQIRAGGRALFGADPRFIPTAGVGIRTGALRLDAAISLDREVALGTTSAISIGYHF